MRRTCVALVVLASCLLATPASADEVNVEKSRALFEEGRVLLESGNCTDAMDRLRQSLALNESVGARLSLGSCLRRDHRLEAWQELKRAQFFATKGGDPRATYAKNQAATLEPDLAMIRIAIAQADLALPELRVELDGVPLERFYYATGAMAVEAGRHTISVSALGRTTKATQEARAVVGAPVTLEFSLAENREMTPEERARVGRTQRLAGVAVGGAGVVGVGVGVIFGLVASSRLSDAKDECTPYPTCVTSRDPAAARDANDRATSAATTSTVGFVAGAVLLAAGAVLYLTAPKAASVAPHVGGSELTIRF